MKPRGPRPHPGYGALLLALAVLAVAPVVLVTLRFCVFDSGVGDYAWNEVGPLLGDVKMTTVRWRQRFVERVHTRATEQGLRIAFYISDPTRGWQISYRDDEKVYLASGIKLLFMIELLRRREIGDISLDEKLRYEPDMVRDGAPAMNRMALHTEHTLRSLLRYMTRDSDNAAADMILRRVGAGEVREHIIVALERLGLHTARHELGEVVPLIDVRRQVYRRLDARADQLTAYEIRDVRWRDGFHPRLDLLKKHIGPPEGNYEVDDLEQAYEQYYAESKNSASMRSIGLLLEAIAARELVSPEASDDMLWLLEHTYNSGRRVEGKLPPGTRVAHKTGTQQGRICDLAIVYLPDGTPLIIAAAVSGGERLPMEDLIADLTQDVWRLATGDVQPLRTATGASHTRPSPP